MDHEGRGFETEIGAGKVDETVEGAIDCAAGIFGEIVFGAVLVAGQAHDVHQVVVGGGEVVECLLPHLLGDLFFFDRCGGFLVFLGFGFVFIINDGNSGHAGVAGGEFLFADINNVSRKIVVLRPVN